jgi:hypothetical protein
VLEKKKILCLGIMLVRLYTSENEQRGSLPPKEENQIDKYLPLNNRHIFGRLFFGYTSLLFIAIVKMITKNNASSTQKIPAPKNDAYLRLGT